MKTKLPRLRERNEIVAREESVTDIPPVVVAKPVDIHVPLPVVAVHVDNRDASYGKPSVPLSVVHQPTDSGLYRIPRQNALVCRTNFFIFSDSVSGTDHPN